MKTAVLLIKMNVLLLFFTGFGHKTAADKTFVKISESDNVYALSAKYNEAKTLKIQQYMNDGVTTYHDMSFVNAQLNATITLNSKMSFYVKLFPGVLELKFDKRKNSTADYIKFKKMCEGIKGLIGER